MTFNEEIDCSYVNKNGDVGICVWESPTAQPKCEGFFEFGCTKDTLNLVFKGHELTAARCPSREVLWISDRVGWIRDSRMDSR